MSEVCEVSFFFSSTPAKVTHESRCRRVFLAQAGQENFKRRLLAADTQDEVARYQEGSDVAERTAGHLCFLRREEMRILRFIHTASHHPKMNRSRRFS